MPFHSTGNNFFDGSLSSTASSQNFDFSENGITDFSPSIFPDDGFEYCTSCCDGVPPNLTHRYTARGFAHDARLATLVCTQCARGHFYDCPSCLRNRAIATNFVCRFRDECGMYFGSRSALRLHERITHSKETYDCYLCIPLQRQYKNLELHYENEHYGDVPLEHRIERDVERPTKLTHLVCYKCHERFLLTRDLKLHKQSPCNAARTETIGAFSTDGETEDCEDYVTTRDYSPYFPVSTPPAYSGMMSVNVRKSEADSEDSLLEIRSPPSYRFSPECETSSKAVRSQSPIYGFTSPPSSPSEEIY